MTISKATKVEVYEMMVLSILCYNLETWTLTAEMNRELKWAVYDRSWMSREGITSKMRTSEHTSVSHRILWKESRKED